MARTNWNPEVGPLPANVGGEHGGIALASKQLTADAPVQGDNPGNSGHTDAALPWEGADSTAIGFDTALPPLTHLGDASGGHA